MKIKYAGAVSHFDIFKKYIGIVRRLQSLGYVIDVYDGTNLCKWNGGRANKNQYLTDDIVNFYNDNGMGVSLTFTNNIIDCSDKVGNDLLHLLNKSNLNSVVIVDDGLRRHIRSEYPNLSICYSLSGSASTIEGYKSLEGVYDYICPRSEFCINEDFIKSVNLVKYVVLLEQHCINCPQFDFHFNKLSEINREYDNPYIEDINMCHKWNDCILPDYNSDNNEGVPEYLTKSMVSWFKSKGYVNFKLPGRDFPSQRYEEMLMRSYNIFRVL